MKVPPELPEEINTKGKACKLKQALQGYGQSVQYQTLSKHLESKEFKKMKSDKCKFKYEKGKFKLIMGIFGDDLLLVYSDEQILDEVLNLLREKFTIKKLEDTDIMIGI